MSDDSHERGQALCRSCGLCCDGTLLAEAQVGAREQFEPAFAAGAQWMERDGKRLFVLPCHAFDGCCTVYDGRPRACRTYRCALLRRCDAGEETWARAHDIVRQARAHRDRLLAPLREAIGTPGPRRSLVEQMRALRALGESHGDQVTFRRNHGPVLVGYAVLSRYLRKHFRRPRTAP
jgi:uncharacterized protein